MNRLQVWMAAVICVAASASAQQRFAQQKITALEQDIDPAIAKVIADTRAFDNHAHPVLSPPADTTDRGFDALPVDNMEPETDPVGWRPDNAALHDAWLALYGIDAKAPLKPDEQKKLDAARAKVKAREGEHYSQWVLDQANIGTMAANRVAMGTGVQPPRFLWVPYDDALLFPLDNTAIADTPDRVQFFALEEKVQQQYLAAANVKTLPATLDEYVRAVVLPTLTHQKQGGAIAIKFELAYLRSLDIGKPSHDEAAAIYAKYANTSAHNGAPSQAEYKLLQDDLLHIILKRCGELGMVAHFHGMAGGGRFFSIAGANPLNLEPLLNDPTLTGTNIVLLHGGWPFVNEAGAMLQKPNFYIDLSQQAILIPAHTLSTWLREWLEMYPDKVLFATDAYPLSPFMGWEESAWLASRNARQALGLALTGMQRDGEITPKRAAELAHMVLHANAESLYKLRIDNPR